MKRSLLIKIHLYCGLFTVFYLIAFGLSSLIMNHKIEVERSDITESWDTEVFVDSNLPNQELAESVKNQLEIMGWTPYWKQKRDSVTFEFTITHPGRNYRLNLDLLTGGVEIGEAPKGFLAVLHGLHFFNGKVPNAPFLLKTWAVYQWLTLLTMLVSLILGLWLWLRHHYQSWEGLVFGGLFVLTLLIMTMI